MLRILAIARTLASLPLLGIGAMHLFGTAPLAPILEGARIPMAEANAQVAPVIEVLAGLLLLVGWRARLGALLGLFSMIGALTAHLRFDHSQFEWPDEPPIALPITVLVLCLLVILRGGGAWSLDARRNR
ncbi:MAG: DoxX family membrane protein [Planctomycetes bacterium]|nr:DoxX family membrane protein [Planctomycetota bacterium]MCB9908247.1 DoxX family membrane protein [Planctomycetota bacterium]HRV82440.1 DoxX family membrane protein [Planctomycetota bacterium]